MPDRSDARAVEADTAQALANRDYAHALMQSFVGSGVRHVVCCPGSRSTALAMAAWDHADLDLTVHWDERGAAFFALGIGRATGIPAVWITTSGTAIANGMPAAVEADADDVPLVLLTADRPPELRHTGANQTIHQPGFFASVARWDIDLPTPRADGDPRVLVDIRRPSRLPRAASSRWSSPPQRAVSQTAVAVAKRAARRSAAD